MNDNEPFDSAEQVEQLDMMPDGSSVPAAMRILRLRRILAYQARALSKKHLLRSNLAAVNSGLLQMALQLEQTIDEIMAQAPLSDERMQLLFKSIDAHLRVARQIDRFAQIELRRIPREQSPKKKIEVECWIDDSTESAASTSEELNI